MPIRATVVFERESEYDISCPQVEHLTHLSKELGHVANQASIGVLVTMKSWVVGDIKTRNKTIRELIGEGFELSNWIEYGIFL